MPAPKYRVIATTWLDMPDSRSETGIAPRLMRVDEKKPLIIRYDGWPNSALEPQDDEAKRRVEIVAQYRKAARQLPATVEDHDKIERQSARAKLKAPAESKAA